MVFFVRKFKSFVNVRVVQIGINFEMFFPPVVMYNLLANNFIDQRRFYRCLFFYLTLVRIKRAIKFESFEYNIISNILKPKINQYGA